MLLASGVRCKVLGYQKALCQTSCCNGPKHSSCSFNKPRQSYYDKAGKLELDT